MPLLDDLVNHFRAEASAWRRPRQPRPSPHTCGTWKDSSPSGHS